MNGKLLKVIFEDNHLLVVEKPAGLPTQGDKTGDESLLDQAKEYLKKKYEKPGNAFVGLVHRLDRPVGGLVVLAKTSKCASRLSELFRTRDIEKKYLALVEGRPTQSQGRLEHFLGPGPQNKVKASASEKEGFKQAILTFSQLPQRHEKFPECTFLEVDLHTGRKHQIRAQLSFAGHAIVGDRKYGSRTPLKAGRIALVAHKISFAHPETKEMLHFELPLKSSWPV